VSGQFSVDQVWAGVQSLLADVFQGNVQVDCIGEKDFNEEGMLTIVPPAARVLFIRQESKPIEDQNLNYWAEQEYAVLCADSDLSQDPQAQRTASILIADQVSGILAGARIALPDGTISAPIELIGITPLPTADFGVAYVVAIKVSCDASFAGTYARPSTQGAQTNG
jgi:hypothetical protein